MYRFINRCWTLVQEFLNDSRQAELSDDIKNELLRIQHATIKKVTNDLYNAQFNTAVSALMEYLNGLAKLKVDGFDDKLWRQALGDLCQLLAPFAPHVANEMYCEMNGDDRRLDNIEWPKYDEKYLATNTVKLAVQVMVNFVVILRSTRMLTKLLSKAKL